MEIGRIKYLILLLLFSNSLIAQSRIEIKIDAYGRCNASVAIVNQGNQENLFVPFSIGENFQFKHNEKLILNALKVGDDYSLLNFISPKTDTVRFQIENLPIVTNHGNSTDAIVSFNTNYQYVSESLKDQYDIFSKQKQEIIVKLPKEYDDKEVNIKNFKRLSLTSFQHNGVKGESYLIFPSPVIKSIESLNFIFGLIFGFIILFISKPSIDSSSIFISLLFLVGSLILIGIMYFAVKSGFIYQLGISSSIPILFYGIYNTIRSIKNKFFSIRIFGYVKKGNSPKRIVDIEIKDILNNKVLKKIEETDGDGSFDVSISKYRKDALKFKIISTIEAEILESQEYEAKKGEKIEYSFNHT